MLKYLHYVPCILLRLQKRADGRLNFTIKKIKQNKIISIIPKAIFHFVNHCRSYRTIAIFNCKLIKTTHFHL